MELLDLTYAATATTTATTPHGKFAEGNPYICRMVRWPPSSFLFRDPLRLRIATILATRGMLLSDLVRLCQEAEAGVRSHLQAFYEAGLIDLNQFAAPAPAGGTREGRVIDIPFVESKKPKAGLGLIAKIRRRLGI